MYMKSFIEFLNESSRAKVKIINAQRVEGEAEFRAKEEIDDDHYHTLYKKSSDWRRLDLVIDGAEHCVFYEPTCDFVVDYYKPNPKFKSFRKYELDVFDLGFSRGKLPANKLLNDDDIIDVVSGDDFVRVDVFHVYGGQKITPEKGFYY